MFALFIALIVTGGSLSFGVVMTVGAMLYTGRWTLPGSRMREIQEATTRKEIAALEAETEQHRFFREQLITKRDLHRVEATAALERASDASFQRAIGAGNGDSMGASTGEE